MALSLGHPSGCNEMTKGPIGPLVCVDVYMLELGRGWPIEQELEKDLAALTACLVRRMRMAFLFPGNCLPTQPGLSSRFQ